MSSKPKFEMESPPQVPLWRRPDTIAIVVLLCLTLVMIWHRWVFDNWLARHDLIAFFVPWLGALGDRLGELDVPALNPYIFSGAPFAGDPESGWMYLPAMLVFPFFEVTVAYKLMILLLLVIAGTSTYALARVIGYGVLAALFSAISFEFGPFLFGQTDCCTVGTKLTAFFPLAFLGIELALRARSWPTRLAAWVIGGFAISQMFAAWLGQGVGTALLIIAAWVVFRTLIVPPDRDWTVKQRLAQMFTTGPAVLVLGLLIGAAGILPRFAANAESNNPGGSYEHTPGQSDGAFHTFASTLERLMVDGLAYRGTSVWGVVLILMVLSFFLMRRNSAVPFFAGVSVVIPALGMGMPLLIDLFYLIPVFETIHSHSPGRILWLYSFFPAMLAGGILNELPQLSSMSKKKWLIAIAPLALVALTARHVEQNTNADVGVWLWSSATATTIALLIVAAAPTIPGRFSSRRIVQGATALLVALAFLLPNGVDIVNTLREPDPPPGELVMWGNDEWMQDLIHEYLRTDDPDGPGEFLQQQQENEPPFRFIAYGGMYHPDTAFSTYPDRRFEPAMVANLQNSRPMQLELETTQGYNPLQPLVYQEFMQALNRQEQNYHYANLLHTGVNSPLLDLLNVRYIVVDRNIPEDRADHVALSEIRDEVYRDEDVIVYESPTVQPRAWMVYDVRPDHHQIGLTMLANGHADGANVGYVHARIPDTSAPTDNSEPEVSLETWSEDSLTFDVTHTGEGLLVVSQVYSDDWHATVNGEEVDVVQTNHALLGIPIGPGEHSVTVSFDPPSLTLGLWITSISGVFSLLVLAYAGWTGMSQKRRTRSMTPTGNEA